LLGDNIVSVDPPLIPLDLCIAKTVNELPGVSVETHCTIVALIAKELVKILPPNIQNKLFPKGTDLIAALHDIGKVSPSFQKMIYENVEESFKEALVDFSQVDKSFASRLKAGFHAAVSQVSLDKVGNYIPEIVGIHHGFSPTTGHLVSGCALHGGKSWQGERLKLISKLKKNLSYSETFWPKFSETQANVIAGLVTVADWIGSGDFFSEYTRDDKLAIYNLEEQCKIAVAQAGFRKIKVKPDLSFTDIFPFCPNISQATFVSKTKTPGLYILEAPMGLGKTEAALYAAYQLLDTGQATGIYFALPTQLTSEKIHERMGAFVERIVDSNYGYTRTHLLHGDAWLKEAVFGVDGDVGGSWFDGSKRGILAPFAAGTIDQALMAVMNVRHGFVRAFGLLGKVVILDEVHSYDTFTGTILNKLVKELLKMHCTVIILSATLTAKQKKTLLGIDESKILSEAYPLVSTAIQNTNKTILEYPCELQSTDSVAVSCTSDFKKCIEEALKRANQKQQVLWIENTVQEAQDIYRLLSARCSGTSIECGLLHSRFIANDRQKIENKWVALYGKDGQGLRKEKGRILVGTQVLEQSIDIDSDFMVSRLCPTDMLLQRTGRLWRHQKNNTLRQLIGAKREVFILAPSLQEAYIKEGVFGRSGKVYSEYVLLRSLEVLSEYEFISVPGDIRTLIDKTYTERKEEGLAAKYKYQLEIKKETLQSLARVGLSKAVNTLPESKASTRYSELENTEVLLLSNKMITDDGMRLVFLDGSTIDINIPTKNRKRIREIASTIKRNTVKVLDYLAPEVNTGINSFKDFVYIGANSDEEPFRAAIVSRDNEIVGLDTSQANKTYILHYDNNMGYQSEKR